jgi:hypothetical protein
MQQARNPYVACVTGPAGDFLEGILAAGRLRDAVKAGGRLPGAFFR